MSQCTMHRWYIQFIHLDIPVPPQIHYDTIAIVYNNHDLYGLFHEYTTLSLGH